MSSDTGDNGSYDPIGAGIPISGEEWRQIVASLKLSPREKQIAELLLLDLSEVRIGTIMGISHHTVHTHKERIFRKVGVNSKLQLAHNIFTRANALKSQPQEVPDPTNNQAGRITKM